MSSFDSEVRKILCADVKKCPAHDDVIAQIVAAHDERVVRLREVLERIVGDGFDCGACNATHLAKKALEEK